MSFQFFRIEQFPGKNGLFLIFIRIKRRYSLFCGTVFLIGKAHLFKLIHISVPRKQKRSTVTDFEIIGSDLNAF